MVPRQDDWFQEAQDGGFCRGTALEPRGKGDAGPGEGEVWTSLKQIRADDENCLCSNHGYETPKQAAGYYTLRFAGLFDLQISIHL